jgi:hypothetical protein
MVAWIKHNKQIIVFANEVKQSSSEFHAAFELDCFTSFAKTNFFTVILIHAIKPLRNDTLQIIYLFNKTLREGLGRVETFFYFLLKIAINSLTGVREVV